MRASKIARLKTFMPFTRIFTPRTAWRVSPSYFSTLCKSWMARDKVAVLRSTYIRPEDVHLYVAWGVSHFKLVDRNRSTGWIQRVIAAYDEGRWPGNLADILSLFSRSETSGREWPVIRPDMGRKEVQAMKGRGALDMPMYIHNSRLDGHLLHLDREWCMLRNHCEECGFCKRISEEAIEYLPEINHFLANAEAITSRF